MPEMLTIVAMSRKTGIAANAIRKWILSGKFKGYIKAGNKYLINVERFKDFLNGGDSNET